MDLFDQVEAGAVRQNRFGNDGVGDVRTDQPQRFGNRRCRTNRESFSPELARQTLRNQLSWSTIRTLPRVTFPTGAALGTLIVRVNSSRICRWPLQFDRTTRFPRQLVAERHFRFRAISVI